MLVLLLLLELRLFEQVRGTRLLLGLLHGHNLLLLRLWILLLIALLLVMFVYLRLLRLRVIFVLLLLVFASLTALLETRVEIEGVITGRLLLSLLLMLLLDHVLLGARNIVRLYQQLVICLLL